MASSRWKRFAFFDRQTYNLPPHVIDDLIPRNSKNLEEEEAKTKGLPAGGVSSLRRRMQLQPLDDAILFPEEYEEGGLGEKGGVSRKGEYFSLIVTNAKVCEECIPHDLVVSDLVKGGVGVKGMLSTVAACTDPSVLYSDNNSSNNNNNGGDLMTTTTTTTGVSNISSDGVVSGKGGYGSGSGSSELLKGNEEGVIGGVGLVLILVSSRNTSKVHVVDVTVRTNPFTSHPNTNASSSSSASETTNTATATATAAVKVEERDNEEDDEFLKSKEEMEDLDGWRGYFQPFARGFPDDAGNNNANILPAAPTNAAEQRIIADHLAASAAALSSSSDQSKQGRVVALASCTIQQQQHTSQNTSTNTNNKNNIQSIHVASITDTPSSIGVVVHIDPHLHLSTNITSHAPPPSYRKSTSMSYYQPSAKFDFVHRGKPTCVDIIPNIVAVGTDSGIVVVYSYGTTLSRKNVGGTGTNAPGKLMFVMEITPPQSLDSISSSSSSSSSSPLKKKNYESDNKKKISFAVSSLKLVSTLNTDPKKSGNKTMLFVTYRRRQISSSSSSDTPNQRTITMSPSSSSPSKTSSKGGGTNTTTTTTTGGGVCCYDLGIITDVYNTNNKASARYDLDGRDVSGSCLTDVVYSRNLNVVVKDGGGGGGKKDKGGESSGGKLDHGDCYMVARPDGLYTYSFTDKIGVSPIDGTKIAVCAVPPPPMSRRMLSTSSSSPYKYTSAAAGSGGGSSSSGGENSASAAVMDKAGASYSLVATTDSKSGRDAVDIYDATNKLVAFHVLLSPGHRALRTAGVTTFPTTVADGSVRGGRSSAVVFTSGGSIVTLTEKITSDKVGLLVQKNLYSAAISMAFADPAYKPSDITALYRRHAEHLYRKGDFAGSMDQFIYTIGSLEPSHVIFRYLDAPKIPLLAKYLEELRSRDLATSVHNELLRTCYLKLNDTEAAEKIAAAASASMDASSCASIVSSLAHNPTEALATICSFEAPQAAESLVVHGATLARALPRETAGVVVSLCDGSYSPSALADAAAGSPSASRRATSDTPSIPEESLQSDEDRPNLCDQYPVHLFSSAFLENPKLLRLILAHCKTQKCFLSPSLQRTLLELTLEEWNNAKRTGDAEVEKIRRNEAIATLTDPNVEEIGDYEALVIVQGAGFTEGEVLLYEKLQMAPLLLEQYAKDGGERARRQMIAMCRSDPELLADVLGYFVIMAAEKTGLEGRVDNESVTSDNEAEEILEDIRETLLMARDQGVLPPARIARILAGEGVGQFSSDQPAHLGGAGHSVPLSVALDYVGDILDESSKDISRLKADVEEYTQLCNSMEAEIKTLLSAAAPQTPSEDVVKSPLPHVNIEEMYAIIRESNEDNAVFESNSENVQEEFWRDMNHSEDRFDTIARYFGKGIMK